MTPMTWGRAMGSGLLGWCAGAAVQVQQPVLWPVWGYAVLLVLSLGVGRWLLGAWRAGWRAGGWCAAGLAVSFSVAGLHAGMRSHAIDPALEGHDLDVVGVVQAMPQRQDQGWRFRFEVEQAWRVDVARQWQALAVPASVPRHVYLGWYGQEGMPDRAWSTSPLPEPVKAGERWRLRVRLKAPHGHLNPRGFDYELWLWEQGIRATGYVRMTLKDPAPVRLAVTWAHPIERWRQSVRERLLTHLSPWGAAAASDWAKRTQQLAGVVAALVTGDQAAIDRSDWDVFRATGVAHLMSISGLHVTMFAWLASAAMAWCWRKSALWGFMGALRWPAVHVGAVSGLALAGFYALFSGWGVPAQRTLCMLAVVVVLKISARQWHSALIWLLAGAVVLGLDPWALLHPGFWLSFVAVGVLLASDRSHPTLEARRELPHAHQGTAQGIGRLLPSFGHPRSGMVKPPWAMAALRGAWHLLREQATITLALAPLTLLFFGQVSLVGLLANVLAIPWVTLVVTPLAMLGVVLPGAWTLSVAALRPLMLWLDTLAAWPMASVSTAMPPWGLALLALVGAFALVLKLPLSWKLLCVPLLWPALLWVHPRPAQGTFEVMAADVGQGNAVLVRTASHSMLYDAGPRYSAESDAGHRVLVPLLAQMGERIDMLMLSHRDSDHTGGAAAVLTMQPQAALHASLEQGHPLLARVARPTQCAKGQSWQWDGVLFEVLHPAAERNGHEPTAKANAQSCVLRISSGLRSVLLAGDIEAPQERALVAQGLAKIDLLLVPHHGSKTSSSPEFLQALSPQIALVQAGYRNRFGHPAPAVVARYAAMNIQLIDSVHCGAATWHSDAPTHVRCERERARRYWHHVLP